MKVSETRIVPSPEGSGRIRFAATVSYDDARHPAEEYWIDFEEHIGRDLQPSGNPWLVALLPLAAERNEPLRIESPVDPLLLEGVHANLRIWQVWYPNFSHPPIEVTVLPRSRPASCDRIASFFSGGADSFFTALFHDSEPEYMAPINELITIWGFDIPLSRTQEIERARASLTAAAQRMRKSNVFAWTNLRETRLNELDWSDHTHGTSLAAVGLCLEHRYWRLLAPANYGPTPEGLKPHGTHPLTEPNYSTHRMQYVFDGTSFGRYQKIGFLAKSDVAMDHLRICWESMGAANCSKCSKCVRAMIGLAAYGALDRCTTFDKSQFSIERVRTMRARNSGDVRNFQILLDGLPPSCDPALRAALEECLDANRRYFSRVKRFEKLEMTPWVGWLFGHYKRRFVLQRKPG